MRIPRLAPAALAAVLFFAPGPGPALQSKEAPAAAAEMTTYYVVFLVRGEAATPAESERQQLQEKHIGHLKAMHAAGKLVIAGPFLDDQTIRGICVYKTASAEEARTLAEADPAVKSGRLKVEVHPWMVQKGILP